MMEEIEAPVNPEPILEDFWSRIAGWKVLHVGCHIAVFLLFAKEEKSEETGGHCSVYIPPTGVRYR